MFRWVYYPYKKAIKLEPVVSQIIPIGINVSVELPKKELDVIDSEQRLDDGEQTTAFLLSQITSGNHLKTIQLSYLIAHFKGRSFGGLLLILSILALLPVVSFVAGIIIFIVGVQMLLGLRVPSLPQFVMQQKVDKRSFEAFVDKVLPWLLRSEKYIRPRWYFFDNTISQRLLGGLILLLALVSLLPFTF